MAAIEAAVEGEVAVMKPTWVPGIWLEETKLGSQSGIQGDTSGCAKPPFDIDLKVAF